MTKEEKAAIMAIFTPVLGEELASDIISHRKNIKCPLTQRAAKSLLKEYELTGNPVSAAEMHLNRGWRGFSHEWIKKPHAFTDVNNPTRKESEFARHQRECTEALERSVLGDRQNDHPASHNATFDLEPGDWRTH